MFTHPTTRLLPTTILLCAATLPANFASADNVLRLYGPPGPSPALGEAATAFEASTGVRVEVKVGPVEQWATAAEKDADIIYATADYLMSRLLRMEKL